MSEPIMHELFLGIEKNLAIDTVAEWAIMAKCSTYLNHELLICTEAIEKLRLSWCKVQPWKGEKLGGWIAENFVGFARINLWGYKCLTHVQREPPFEAPTKAIGQWNSKECKGFLQA